MNIPSDKPSIAVCGLPSAIWLFLGGLCYYLALPPVNFAPLALAVPICWGIVIQKERGTLVPRWSYLTALLFWLASIWWVACPCLPYTALGLLALAAYLSLYWLLFFVSARVAVHRLHIPLLAAMPICWIGTEYLRCHVLGGFSFCALEHAFYKYPPLIQFASVGGSTLVGGIIMFLGAAILTRVYAPKSGIILYGVLFLFLLFSFSLLRESPYHRGKAALKKKACSIAALQGNKQVHIHSDPDKAVAEARETFKQFVHLTYQTIHDLKQNKDPLPDLIVFSETVCPIPVLVFEGSVKPADVGLTEEEAVDWEKQLRQFVQSIETPVLFGISTYVFRNDPDKPMRLNSALLVQPDSPLYRYDKTHLVMFGEYIPFAEYLPDDFFLKTLCPEAQRGSKPVAMPISVTPIGQGTETVEASVNICFESSVAHLIRHQILTLRREGHDPQVLINMSNDGWFRFSPQIEQHLATHVFRAVENRMYYVSATNGGFSAIINPYGEITSIGKRGEAEAVMGCVYARQGRGLLPTIYQQYGDWYALVCAVIVLGLVVYSIRAVIVRLRECNKSRNGAQ